ncbi:MAG: MerR family transcriptional regulator [Solobacterium sp.]|nr:MerR family transcriptional regulator [Solobacterium sp.]
MKQYFKIGEMAELTHVSPQTLRLYAKNGLLIPEHLDQETGYRYYTLEQCARLDMINALKSCEMPLAEIRELFEAENTEMLADILQVKADQLKQKLYSLSVSQNNLRRVEKNLRLLNALPPVGLPFFEYQEDRFIDVQKTSSDFFSEGVNGYEKMVRHMQNYMSENKIPPTYFINIGTMIAQEDFIAERYTSSLAFVFADSMYPGMPTVRKLPKGLYLSIVSDHIDKELEFARKLHAEIAGQSLQVNGDYICEVLSQFPFRSSSELYFRIQIPVIKRT